MSKRERKRRRRKRSGSRSWRRREPAEDLDRVFTKAESLIGRGRVEEAIDVVEPLLQSHPREADVHYYLGYARLHAGDLWGALAGYKRAQELSGDPSFYLPLASIYLDLGLRVHGLHAFREMFEHEVEVPMIDAARKEVAALEQDLVETADNLGLPVPQVEEGVRYLEEGQIALHAGDRSACIAANHEAIERLGDWPPPHNNLSMALFLDGRPEEAIATARQVLSHASQNLQALSNIIRYLAWTGQEDEAREFWSVLRDVAPVDFSNRMKKAEAAAVLGEDEAVYELLKPLDQPGSELGGTWQAPFFLAVAEANTGRRRSAQRRLAELRGTSPWIDEYLAALRAGKPGLGWADRFPYFSSNQLMPRQAMERFMALVEQQDELPERRFRREVRRFVESYPQIVRVGEKLIWEEGHPEAGITILSIVETPAAYAALRRFGLSQAGEDDVRMQALYTLADAGQIPKDETLRVWIDGEWRDTQLRQYEVTDEPDVFYSPEVADLLNQGQTLYQQGNYEEAERLFQRALELEPQAKEAYNNLATIYAHRGEHERAKKMYRAVIDVDPTYVFPRSNLAIYLLDEGDIEGAEEVLKPLADRTRWRPQELAFYSYVQARVALHREEYEVARKSLEAALEVVPDYEPATDLLDRLDEMGENIELISRLRQGWESRMQEFRKRDRAWRERLQANLTTPDPTLSEVLPLYTKDGLTGIANLLIPSGGWSALRKAELVDELITALEDRDNLERIVANLRDEERAALREVLEHGGSMPWQAFDAQYGNDLEESRYWNWHQPETVMGRLRVRGLLAEATVDDELLILVPVELRRPLREILSD